MVMVVEVKSRPTELRVGGSEPRIVDSRVGERSYPQECW